MAAIKSHYADTRWRIVPVLSVVIALALALAFSPCGAAPRLSEKPVIWYSDDQTPIPMPKERDPNLVWDMIDDSVVLPGYRTFAPHRLTRRVGSLFGGDHTPAAVNVNSLDEVPNSTWFTNRIGFYPLSPNDVAIGPMTSDGPTTDQPWIIVSAKTQGVTPGFVIRDSKGGTWLIKFDPSGMLGMTTGAGVISNRILHAAGYNVPEDTIVRFLPEQLKLSDKVKLKLPDGTKRLMTQADLTAILDTVDTLGDGTIHAIASRYLSGRPLGPFNFHGQREDDPNDKIKHQYRRELRGLRIFAAWLNHFDTKQHNSLDMYIGDEGDGFIRHYLIDFASTLGAGAGGLSPRYGYEYTVDLFPVLGRIFALGAHEDAWRQLERPAGLAEIGFFEAELFDPLEFKPMQPNSAFADLTDRDGYWAAKIISAFTDDQIRGIAEQARFRNSEATDYMTEVLCKRRDKIAKCFFDRLPPLDFWQFRDGRVSFTDLGAQRGIYPGQLTTYRYRWANVSANGDADHWSGWHEQSETEIDLSENTSVGFPFIAVQCRLNRGDGWSKTCTACFSRRSGATVAMER
jgi:hypothetical protein